MFLQNADGETSVLGPGSASATLEVNRDGTVDIIAANTFGTAPFDWATPKSATVGDDFEVRLTKTSGIDPTPDALATWLPLTTDRSWGIGVSGTDELEIFAGTLEIRLASNGAVLATSSITLEAEVFGT